MNLIFNLDQVKELKKKSDGSPFYIVTLKNGYSFYSNPKYAKVFFCNITKQEKYNVWIADTWKTKVSLTVYDNENNSYECVDQKELTTTELREMNEMTVNCADVMVQKAPVTDSGIQF